MNSYFSQVRGGGSGLLAVLILIVCAMSTFAQAEAGKIDVSRIPAQAKDAASFVPAGWKIEEQVTGDLNGDSLPDFVIKLVEDKPAKDADDMPTERGRALVIALAEKDGNLKRAGVADKLLQCTRCGGAFYGVVESPAGVSIEKGVVVVEQDHGSRNLTNTTYKFRFEPATQRFRLIGFELADADRLTAQVVSESSNYLTNSRVITRSKGDRDIKTKSGLSRTKFYLEDVSSEEFEIASYKRLGLY
ncbi:MAG: hypothetical protein WAQ99_09270 [Pyrinomonadaceae bacterium]